MATRCLFSRNFYQIYKLKSLVSETANFQFEAHSSLEDAKAFRALVQHHQVTEDLLLKHSFGVDYVEASIRHKTQTEELLKTLRSLESCVSKYMLKNVLCLYVWSFLPTFKNLLVTGRGGEGGRGNSENFK